MDVEFVESFDESSWYVVTAEDVPRVFDVVDGCDFSEIISLSVVAEGDL